MEIDVGGPNESCGKYVTRGDQFLRITHARILETNGPGASETLIVGNQLCEVKSYKNKKYSLTCDGIKATQETCCYYVMISVTTVDNMLSGPIDYRYREKVMELVKNKRLDSKVLKSQKFEHDQHLNIKGITVKGMPQHNGIGDYGLGDCHELFPKTLIADHGLYLLDGPWPNFFVRMYYEPFGINEYLVLP